MRYKQNLGFSLIEVFLILTILSVIASISIPYFNNFFAHQEAHKTLKVINSLLRSAKNEAAIRHTNVVLCSSSTGNSCENNQWGDNIVVFVDVNANRKIDQTTDLVLHIEPLNLKYGQLIWKGTLNSSAIVFNKEVGLPIGYNGSFYYCNATAGLFHKIILSKMSHIRSEKLKSC